MVLKIFKRLLILVLLAVLAVVSFVYLFQHRIIYFPQRSSSQVVGQFLGAGGRRIDYTTSQGKQAAWLLPARNGRAPERLWIVCAGNASQGLSLSILQEFSGLNEDAFLMIDYPGYGVGEGKPSPATIREKYSQVGVAGGQNIGDGRGETAGTRNGFRAFAGGSLGADCGGGIWIATRGVAGSVYEHYGNDADCFTRSTGAVGDASFR